MSEVLAKQVWLYGWGSGWLNLLQKATTCPGR
jgi:hypothetical protein